MQSSSLLLDDWIPGRAGGTSPGVGVAVEEVVVVVAVVQDVMEVTMHRRHTPLIRNSREGRLRRPLRRRLDSKRKGGDQDSGQECWVERREHI